MPIDEPLISAVTVSVLIVVTLCAITDILEHRIYNRVLLPALALALPLNALLAGLPGLVDSLLGLMLGMAMLFPLYFLRGTSAGDVKLLGVIGAFLGTEGALIAGIATLCCGGVFGALFIAWRLIEPVLASQVAQIVSRNGPMELSLGSSATGDKPWKSVFPYAPAIACGTCYAMWHLGYFSQMMGQQ